jgi:hypothetical protein
MRDIKIYDNTFFVPSISNSPYLTGYDSGGNIVYDVSSSSITDGLICLALSDLYIYAGAYPTPRKIYQIRRTTKEVTTLLPNIPAFDIITSLSYSSTTNRLYVASFMSNDLYYYDVSTALTPSSQPVFAYTLIPAINDLLSVGNLLYIGTANGLYSISIPNSSGTLVRVIDTDGERVQSLAVRSNNKLYGLVGVPNSSQNVNICEASGNTFYIESTQSPVVTPGQYYSFSFYNDYMYILNDNTIFVSNEPFCFNKGTKILYLNNKMKDKYIVVENLKKGDFVKTYKHGYRKISKIITGSFRNDPTRWNMCMYKMTKTDSNGLLEDLIVTGGHSLLVDSITEIEQSKYDKMGLTDFSKITIDGKRLLLACVSDQFAPMQDNDTYTYYHLLLENNNDEEERFGIYANGILTETPNEKTIK